MADDTGNGRVTLARLSEQIKAQDKRADERHADIKSDLGAVKVCIAEIDNRVRDVEVEQGRNQVQHKLLAGTQLAAFLTAVGSWFSG